MAEVRYSVTLIFASSASTSGLNLGMGTMMFAASLFRRRLHGVQ